MSHRVVYEFLDLRKADIDEYSFSEVEVERGRVSSDISPLESQFTIPSTGELPEVYLHKTLTSNNLEAILYASKYERDHESILSLCNTYKITPVPTGYTNYLIFDGQNDRVYHGLFTKRLPVTPFSNCIDGMDGIYTMKIFAINGKEYLIAVQGDVSNAYISDAIESLQLHPI